MNLPKEIACLTAGKAYRREDIGRSGAEILLYDDMVLKIEKTTPAADREYEILRWLDGKLPTPRVIAFVRENGMNYLLMTKISGKMACDAEQNHEDVVKGLAKGIKMLWNVDLTGCPVRWDVNVKLKLAKEKLAERAELSSLYQALSEHPPKEELVFSHGDYCLPNVFLDGADCIGFLDLGSAGIADKWYDVMMCLWSLSYNFKTLGGMYEEVYQSYEALFFEALGLMPNEEKMNYYAKLDEFFA